MGSDNYQTKLMSTTAIAKANNIPSKTAFGTFKELGYIDRSDGNWVLTDLGKEKGGTYKETKRYGKYIAWPEDIEIQFDQTNCNMITSTVIGKKHELSAKKINLILSEIGWVKKGLKGWLVTEQGKKAGAVQDEDNKSGIPYVRWPKSILDSKTIKETVDHVKGIETATPVNPQSNNEDSVEFREKFAAKHRSTDGHMVRSKAEMLIDIWLYTERIVHAYERKLPIEEDVYCDFYIPAGNVFIEYWGYEDNPKYLARKKKKIELYRKYEFNLIELTDKDVQNLDDVLPRLLLKYGVQSY